jgi:hypothetical protein
MNLTGNFTINYQIEVDPGEKIKYKSKEKNQIIA